MSSPHTQQHLAPLPSGTAELFRHVSADKAALYRAVLDVFAAAKRQYRLQLRPDEVLAEAAWPAATPTAEELAAALAHDHGDFDWPGVAIGNRVLQAIGARPWRFASPDDGAAVQLATAQTRLPLEGAAVVSGWDAAVAAALLQTDCAVAEQALLAHLLPDLAGAG